MKGSGCYNCPVKGCTAEYRGSRCTHLRELAGVDFDPKTRGDVIRSMSDEAMSKDLINMIMDLCEDGIPSEEYALDWFRKPVEEGEHGL